MDQNPLKIEIEPDKMDGIYANMAVITHSSAEFLIDFARMLPNTPAAKVKARIVMAPEHAKRLLLALQNNVGIYERNFGPIELPEANRTANPFHTNKGEA